MGIPIVLLALSMLAGKVTATQNRQWTYMFYFDTAGLRGPIYHARDNLGITKKDASRNIVIQTDDLEKKTLDRFSVQDGLVTETRITGYITKYDPRNHQHIVDFCTWAIEKYPAEQYALIFGGHSTGISGEELSAPGKYGLIQSCHLKPALEKITKLLGKKLDLIAFDSCCMADIGTMELCKDHAHYLLSSQAGVCSAGFPYRKIFAHTHENVSSLMNQFITDFGEYSSISHNEGTLSIIDLSKTDQLTAWCQDFFRLLTLAMQDRRVFEVVKKARKECQEFVTNSTIDLSTFLREFNKLLTTENQFMDYRSPFFDLLVLYASKGMYLVSNIVESSFATYPNPQAHGISICFPKKEPYLFAPDPTKPWHQFLSTFYKY